MFYHNLILGRIVKPLILLNDNLDKKRSALILCGQARIAPVSGLFNSYTWFFLQQKSNRDELMENLPKPLTSCGTKSRQLHQSTVTWWGGHKILLIMVRMRVIWPTSTSQIAGSANKHVTCIVCTAFRLIKTKITNNSSAAYVHCLFVGANYCTESRWCASLYLYCYTLTMKYKLCYCWEISVK